MPNALTDFLFGGGALKKAAGAPSTTSAQPSQPAMSIPALAAQAQQQANRSLKGNDAGMAARGSKQSTQGNDMQLKSRVKPMPTVAPQANDVQLKNGSEDDD